MAHPLDGVRAKIARAEEHADMVYGEVARFLYGKPYETVLEYDPETVTWTVRMRIHREPPLRISTIVGDCIHNLRSGADHLMYALVERAGGTPDKNTVFPIFTTARGWKDGHAQPTRGLSDEVLAEVDAVQPYHGLHPAGHPATHPLRLLHVYWNWDKHNLLIPTWGVIEGLRDLHYSVNDDAGEFVSKSMIPPGEGIENGTVLFRVTFKNPGPNPEMQMLGDLSFEISIGSGPPVTESLRDLTAFVRDDLLPRFERFFA